MEKVLSFLSDHAGTLLLVTGFCLLFGWIMVMDRDRRRAEADWRVVAEGEFDRVEYGYWVKAERHGSMVHTTSYRRMDVTAFYFMDGRSYVLGGRRDMPHPRGTRVRLWKNGVGDQRIEKL
jgi:hypothetical protein